ncbi:hypothetical protein Q3G72_025453 [Acer saccharum]|nr:hypothetical protein Q3G72_025453 [Acer saccharum]
MLIPLYNQTTKVEVCNQILIPRNCNPTTRAAGGSVQPNANPGGRAHQQQLIEAQIAANYEIYPSTHSDPETVDVEDPATHSVPETVDVEDLAFQPSLANRGGGENYIHFSKGMEK